MGFFWNHNFHPWNDWKSTSWCHFMCFGSNQPWIFYYFTASAATGGGSSRAWWALPEDVSPTGETWNPTWNPATWHFLKDISLPGVVTIGIFQEVKLNHQELGLLSSRLINWSYKGLFIRNCRWTFNGSYLAIVTVSPQLQFAKFMVDWLIHTCFLLIFHVVPNKLDNPFFLVNLRCCVLRLYCNNTVYLSLAKPPILPIYVLDSSGVNPSGSPISPVLTIHFQVINTICEP